MPAPMDGARSAPSSVASPFGYSGELALLRHDVELRAAIAVSDLPLAERAVTARRLTLANGPWTPEPDEALGGLAIVLQGMLIQRTELADRWSTQLLDRGAILHDLDPNDSCLPCSITLTSVGTSTIAVLDSRFDTAGRRWPALWRVVHERLAQQLKRAARWNVVGSLPRVEQRLLAAFWLLADHHGIRRADGVFLRLSLTHEMLGTMIGARRPTVSLALTYLADRGLLVSQGRGDWLLTSEPDAILALGEL